MGDLCDALMLLQPAAYAAVKPSVFHIEARCPIYRPRSARRQWSGLRAAAASGSGERDNGSSDALFASLRARCVVYLKGREREREREWESERVCACASACQVCMHLYECACASVCECLLVFLCACVLVCVRACFCACVRAYVSLSPSLSL